MEKITSFTIDHIKLIPGVYVSRVDYVAGNPITTFDLRMTSPNDEPVMNTAEMHTVEHLAATFLRNHPLKSGQLLQPFLKTKGTRAFTVAFSLLRGVTRQRVILLCLNFGSFTEFIKAPFPISFRFKVPIICLSSFLLFRFIPICSNININFKRNF